MALAITDNNFQTEVLDSGKLAVVDFWATWCGPCRAIAPLVEELAKDYEGRAIVGKVNVDDNAEISSKYEVRSIPTILFIKDGKVVDKQVGVVPKNRLVEKIEKYL